MLLGIGINVLLCKSQVNQVDDILVLHAEPTYQEVLRLHVPVHQLPAVQHFDTLQLGEWELVGAEMDQGNFKMDSKRVTMDWIERG